MKIFVCKFVYAKKKKKKEGVIRGSFVIIIMRRQILFNHSFVTIIKSIRSIMQTLNIGIYFMFLLLSFFSNYGQGTLAKANKN